MTRHPAVPLLTALRRRWSATRGFALTEVIAAAAVFALLSLAVLAGVDGAASSTGREKARSVASALAEKEVERMHSVPALSLPGYYSKVDKSVGGVTYTIESEARWVSDVTGSTISCTSELGKADYLRLRTTVSSSTVGTSTAPIEIESLLTPPPGSAGGNNGTLAVQVNNRDNLGVQGIRVDIAGTNSGHADNKSTNALGCAVFANIPADTYDIGFSQLNWVDPEGTLNPHLSGIVTAGATSLKSLLYDAKGKVTTGFDTKYMDLSLATPAYVSKSSKAWHLAASNNGVKSGVRVFEVSGVVPQTTFVADNLFPFLNGYGMYPGKCTEQNPSLFDAAYGAASAYQLVDRNTTYDRVAAAQPLRQPALPVRVADGLVGGSGTYKTRPNWIQTNNVQAKLVVGAGSTCSDFIPSVTTSPTTGLQTYPSGFNPLSGTCGGGSSCNNNYENGMYGFVTKSPGTSGVFDPGLPWGTWIVCADNGSRRNFALVDNTARDGTDLSIASGAYKVINVANGSPAGGFGPGSENKKCTDAWPTS